MSFRNSRHKVIKIHCATAKNAYFRNKEPGSIWMTPKLKEKCCHPKHNSTARFSACKQYFDDVILGAKVKLLLV